MKDDTAMFLICIGIVLFLIYRYSRRGGSYAAEIPLEPGTYRIGEDLSPGKCDIVAVSGTGDICIRERGNDVWNNPFRLGADTPVAPSRYRNMTLHSHDILEVNGNIKLLLTPPATAIDADCTELTLGTYQFGVDVPSAKYDLKALSGSGQFTYYPPKEESFTEFQDMAFNGDGQSTCYHKLLCEDGARLVVDGTLKLKLTRSRKQRGRFYQILDFINQDP